MGGVGVVVGKGVVGVVVGKGRSRCHVPTCT